MAMYQSDYTRFMNEFLEQNPQIQAERLKLRQTWGDRPQDQDDLARFAASRVPPRPYAYQPDCTAGPCRLRHAPALRGRGVLAPAYWSDRYRPSKTHK